MHYEHTQHEHTHEHNSKCPNILEVQFDQAVLMASSFVLHASGEPAGIYMEDQKPLFHVPAVVEQQETLAH